MPCLQFQSWAQIADTKDKMTLVIEGQCRPNMALDPVTSWQDGLSVWQECAFASCCEVNRRKDGYLLQQLLPICRGTRQTWCCGLAPSRST